MIDPYAIMLLVGTAWADDPEPAADTDPGEESAPATDPPPPPDDDAGWIDVGLDVDFGSAVETGLETQAAQETLPPELEGLFAAAGELAPSEDGRALREGRWGARPWLGWMGLSTESVSGGATVGGQLSHQWWTLVERPVRPAGETRVRAVGVVGGLAGWAVSVDATAGAWFGPVGLLAGPSLTADRLQGSGGAMGPAVGVGPTARLAARLGPLTPWVGLTPAWLIAGDRPGLTEEPWDELGRHAGIVWDRRPVGLRLTGGWRSVAAGDLYEATLGLHLRPF